jgi:transposase
MDNQSARKYYRLYLNANHMEIPVPKNKPLTQDRINKVIGYIVSDKMSIMAASKKANMCESSGKKYYKQYLTKHNLGIPPPKITQDKINGLIGYIVDDKMSVKAASKKANVSCYFGYKYYGLYLKDHHINIPIPKSITRDQKSKLIGYIVDDNMSIIAASKKANMSYGSGCKYYHQYLKDQKLDISSRCPRVVPAPKNK